MDRNFDQFKVNYLVAGLCEDDIRRVSELASIKVVTSGTEIVSLGSKDSDLYMILDGTAVVYRKGGVVLGERGPGSVIGEVALVDDQPRSAYVIAKGTLTFAQLDGKSLRRFMYTNPQLGFIMLSNLARVLALRLRDSAATIEDLHGKVGDPWRFTD